MAEVNLGNIDAQKDWGDYLYRENEISFRRDYSYSLRTKEDSQDNNLTLIWTVDPKGETEERLFCTNFPPSDSEENREVLENRLKNFALGDGREVKKAVVITNGKSQLQDTIKESIGIEPEMIATNEPHVVLVKRDIDNDLVSRSITVTNTEGKDVYTSKF